MIFLRIVLLLCAVYAFYAIGKDVRLNLAEMKKCNTANFKGSAVTVQATVTKLEQYRPNGGRSGTGMRLDYVTLSYEAGGVSYEKKLELVDSPNALKAGNTVELIYDSYDPENAFTSDGKEAESAKKGLKWDVGYAVCVVILALFIFFCVLN